jgi:adenine-specific DNA-methyltransferase
MPVSILTPEKVLRRTHKKLAVPQLVNISHAPFIEKVDEILALKKANLNADTSTLEAEIDRMVYYLYELTEEEIAIVEGR